METTNIIKRKKKVLVIGSSGNIGRELCAEYLKSGCVVEGISFRRKNVIKYHRNFKNYNFDYRSDVKLKKFLIDKFYDIVINLIIYNKQQALREFKFFKKNVLNYIFISSVSLYNNAKKKITEKSKSRDLRWPGAKNKYYAEKAFNKLLKNKNFPVTIIRAGHVYNYFTVPNNMIGFGVDFLKLLKLKKKAIIFKKKP